MVAVLFRTLDAWRIFDNPFVMTSGANDTETLSFLAYRQNVTLVNLGAGSAVSVLLFFTVVIIAFVFIKGFKTDLSQVRGDELMDGRKTEQLVDVLGRRHPACGRCSRCCGWCRCRSRAPRRSATRAPAFFPRTGRGTTSRPCSATSCSPRRCATRSASRSSPRSCRWSWPCSRPTPSPASTSRARSCCCRWPSPSPCSRRPPSSVRCSTCGASLGIYDTWIGLIIPYLTFALPLSIWTMSAFFRQIPWEMEQAAQVDGATAWQAFRKVIVPLAAPGVFTTAILTFFFCWNEFLLADLADLDRTAPAPCPPRSRSSPAHSQFESPGHRDHGGVGRRHHPRRHHRAAVPAADRRRPHRRRRQGLTEHRIAHKEHLMAEITMQNIVKKYGDGFPAVNDVSLDIADGEFMILVGPSGCGKSTLLRMIVGLEDITSGDMLIGGERVNDKAPRDRNLAMVFQNYALYPHLSVFENIAFPLRLAQGRVRGRDQGEGRGGGGDARADRAPRPQARQPLRRPAPAGGHGPGDRARRRRRSCSTSRCRTSTPSCAARCAPRSCACSAGWGSPPSTSPTTRPRP